MTLLAKKTRKYGPMRKNYTHTHTYFLSRPETKMTKHPLAGCRKKENENRTENHDNERADSEGKNDRLKVCY